MVLRASAGMDYWEFAQFLSAIGLPRLREAQAILSSLSKPSNNTIATALSGIEMLLLKITTSPRNMTFFESGTLPAELLHRSPNVGDNLAVCDCLMEQAKQLQERETNNVQPFSALYELLPKEFQQVLVWDKNKEDPARQRTRAQLIFRLFELVTINSILSKVLQCVSIR